MTAIDDALRRHVDEKAESAKQDYLERWADDYSAIQSGEDRPAELLLAGYLLTIVDGYRRVDYVAAWDAHSDPEWGTIMGRLVDVGPHTADFLFRVCLGEDRRYLAVTLDTENGRQRSSDAIVRDRGLMDEGCRVLNVSDAEVMSDPTAVADKISSTLAELADQLLAAADLIGGPSPTNVTPIRRK